MLIIHSCNIWVLSFHVIEEFPFDKKNFSTCHSDVPFYCVIVMSFFTHYIIMM